MIYFEHLLNQSSLSFTPNWISFLGRKSNDEFMIINLIQPLFKWVCNEQIFLLVKMLQNVPSAVLIGLLFTLMTSNFITKLIF